ncbi:Gfo/Idh/MocA family protein [Cytobacillus sp. FJAT-53684]|uniref:Gfo/Idh/MocA family protein n=1 Tax=Cytobacillus mangrovibacter TaxID=3299024 RepID=A0ABW6JT36_9BACI
MLNAGLIGCGFISKKHLLTLSKLNNMKLIAVSDILESKMKEAVDFYREITRTDEAVSWIKDYKRILKDTSIDVVIIAVISGLHAQIAKEALHYGKHVILEKPMALSIKDADEMILLSEQQNKQILVCHQMRYRPVMQKLKSLVMTGELGRPYFGVASIRISRPTKYYESASWRGSWALDGGMLVNQGIHLIDLLVWLLGDVESVYGQVGTTNNSKETEDIAAGIVTFRNKAKGIIEANTITMPNNIGYTLSLFCEKGTICLNGPSLNRIERCYIVGQSKVEEELRELCTDMNEHEYMYKNFIDSIETCTVPLIMTAKEGREALETIFGLYKSAKTGHPTILPLSSFDSKEMSE